MQIQRYVVIVNGYPRSGKDTFIRLIREGLHALSHTIQRRSFVEQIFGQSMGRSVSVSEYSSIEPVRELLAPIFGAEKSDAWRIAASDVGQALQKACRFKTNNVLKTCWETFASNKAAVQIMFVHIREPAEIQLVCDALADGLLGFPVRPITILLDRPVGSKRDVANASDQEVEKFDYYLKVVNDGTERDLQNVADWFAYYFIDQPHDTGYLNINARMTKLDDRTIVASKVQANSLVVEARVEQEKRNGARGVSIANLAVPTRPREEPFQGVQ